MVVVQKFTEQIILVTEECITCGVVFAMPKTLKDKLQDDPEKGFYCPNGHSMVYKYNRTQKELNEVKDRLRESEMRIANISMEKVQLEGEIKKRDTKLKRLSNGVCPCCNRSFHNLHQHMKKQHPEQVSPKR